MKTPRFKRTEDNKRLVGIPQYGEKALGKPMGIRFPVDVEQYLRQRDDTQSFVREAVREKIERDRASDNNS